MRLTQDSRHRGSGASPEALDIHPVMLSRWRQEVREGRLRDASRRPMRISKQVPVREIRGGFKSWRRNTRLLKEEHELLKKAIRFCSERRADKFAFIESQCEGFKVNRLCALLWGDSPAGFYAWAESRRPASTTEQDRDVDEGAIRKIYVDSAMRPMGARSVSIGSLEKRRAYR